MEVKRILFPSAPLKAVLDTVLAQHFLDTIAVNTQADAMASIDLQLEQMEDLSGKGSTVGGPSVPFPFQSINSPSSSDTLFSGFSPSSSTAQLSKSKNKSLYSTLSVPPKKKQKQTVSVTHESTSGNGSKKTDIKSSH